MTHSAHRRAGTSPGSQPHTPVSGHQPRKLMGHGPIHQQRDISPGPLRPIRQWADTNTRTPGPCSQKPKDLAPPTSELGLAQGSIQFERWEGKKQRKSYLSLSHSLDPRVKKLSLSFQNLCRRKNRKFKTI